MIEPQQERAALWLLFAWLVFGILGFAVTIGGIGLALIWTAKWVFQ